MNRILGVVKSKGFHRYQQPGWLEKDMSELTDLPRTLRFQQDLSFYTVFCPRRNPLRRDPQFLNRKGRHIDRVYQHNPLVGTRPGLNVSREFDDTGRIFVRGCYVFHFETSKDATDQEKGLNGDESRSRSEDEDQKDRHLKGEVWGIPSMTTQRCIL